MAKVIGIDLGTTNSCVAVVERDEPVVIPNLEGSRTTPSVVAFTSSGERLVGQIAKRQAITNPQNTVYGTKRLIGRKFDSPEIAEQRKLLPFKIVRAKNGDAWISIENKNYSPQEISAMVLAKMKETAESYFGCEIRDAVITVPAYFNDSQRQATKEAGQIAGLNVRRIINEPTAAAMAMGISETKEEIIAVYDLGGGTFDISILEIKKGVISVRAVNGNTYLGGEDFDERIIQLLLDQFYKEHGIDLRKDKMAFQRVKESAERAKQELSSSFSTEINLPFIAVDKGGPRHLIAELKRSQLEDLVSDLIEETLEPCRLALKDAGLTPKDIDRVIMVGGMTRMPKVQERIKEFFKRPLFKEFNPDEIVAIGAAIQGAILEGEIEEVVLLDVTPLSLGVETAGGVFHRIIPRNTTIPTRKSEIFTTSVDNQSFVPIHILQGEREMAEDNKSLARFELTDIPPAPRGIPQIQVTFEIDSDGIVNVSARDLGTGKEQNIKVVASSGLDEAEIQRIIREAEAYKKTDALKRELVELKNQAESLIYTTEQSLQGYGHLISESERDQIQRDISALRKTLVDGDLEAVNIAYRALERSSHKIAKAIYESFDKDSQT
jgi:molecular chaperone DnaK